MTERFSGVVDIEAAGLLDEISGPEDIYMIGTLDMEGRTTCYTGPGIEEGLRVLEDAELLITHNGLGYDFPALRRCFPSF